MNLKKKVFAAALSISAIATAGYAYAATFYVETAYFNDAAHTTLVGETVKTCKNGTHTWGTVTAYSQVVDKYDCSLPIP